MGIFLVWLWGSKRRKIICVAILGSNDKDQSLLCGSPTGAVRPDADTTWKGQES